MMTHHTHLGIVLGIGCLALGGCASGQRSEPTESAAPSAQTEPTAQPSHTQPAATPSPAEPAAQATPEMAEGPDGTPLPVIERVQRQGGLVIETLRQGNGPAVTLDDTITVHTHGTLASDGSVFWTTRGGEPATFPLRALIPGWQQGVPGMRVGEIRRLTIPSALGYGDADRRDASGAVVIPAGSDLVFTIELVGIEGQ